MDNNLMENLNKEQLGAVLHREGPLLIIAGAGTGKTTVITQKIAYMIEQGWAGAEEILALTFTEKAAAEMEERVDRLLPIGYLDLWISTFHSFGERILKAHGLEIGLPSDFKLLNEFEQWILIKKNLDKFELDYYRPMGNPTKFIQALLKHFSRLKDENITPEEYLKYAEGLKENLDNMLSGFSKSSLRGVPIPSTREGRRSLPTGQAGNPVKKSIADGIAPPSADARARNDDREIEEQEVLRINEVANAYHVYQQLLLDNNALDFGDIINYCLLLFKKRPAILEKYRRQFKYVLVDEFQDTNWAQYELVKMLVNKKNNLVVVGDDDQSIYKFRGASVANILQFKKDYHNTKQIILVKNYRSKQDILDLSYEFIKLNNPNRLECQLQSDKRVNKKAAEQALNKKLISQAKGKANIEVIEGEDFNDEIKKVIEKISNLKIVDKKSAWSDFAILVRANDSAKEFCSALDVAGLPYQFLASRGLYVKPIIIDLISYLKLLDNYHENAAFFRILNLPFFNFSHHELVNFNYWAGRKSWSLFEVLRGSSAFNFGADIHAKIVRVLTLISKHAGMVRDKSVSDIIIAFLNDSGYLKYLNEQPEQKVQEAMSYLNQFMKRIKTFEAGSDDRSVKAFLHELRMEIDSGEEGSLAPDMEAGPDAIKIMTAHGAKGLEFKYVFIASMVDKRFPTIERREQIAIPDALIRETLPEGDVHLEEERRLFYVAMTRAKEGLYFSWAEDYGGARKKKPSRFLEEIGMTNNTPLLAKEGLGEMPQGKVKIRKLENFSVNHPTPPNPPFSKGRGVEFPLPSYFSYTQLAAFSNCPHQYRFAHILRIPIRGKGIFSFGKTMHSTLQKLFLLINEKKELKQGDLFGTVAKSQKRAGEIKITFKEIEELYHQSWIDDWYENKTQKEDYRKKGLESLKEFYEKYKDNWPAAILLEKGFSMKLLSGDEIYTVRGTIDRIDEENGKLKIVDYKTGQPKEKLSFGEKEQLLIYQLAAKDLFRQEINSLAFYYLDNNSEEEFLGTAEELGKVKEKIITTIKEIRKGEFPAKPSQLCKWCDFKDICEFR